MKYILNIILALLAVIFMIYGTMQSIEATKQAEICRQRERDALLAEQDAIQQRDRAEIATKKQLEVEQALRDCEKKKR